VKIIRFAFKYFRHVLSARNTGGFGVHSPHIFNFIQFVIKEKHPYYVFEAIENIRKNNLNNHQTIHVKDFGNGKSERRKISAIAKVALKKPKQAQLLFRIIRYFRFQKVMELGTSLGISTLYLAAVSSPEKCITLEGSSEIAGVARQNFREMNMEEIILIECNISEHLENVLKEYGDQDFIFIDANHRYEALKQYFETCVAYTNKNSVVVVDDIYWSAGMEQAWKEIKNHPQVTSTIDIFHMGIVFLNPMLVKKHYKVRC
jgi:predicted O-methyltransferase YrrM